MSNVYLIVGLLLGGAAGYIVSQTIPEAKKDAGIPVMAGGGVMLLWLPLLAISLLVGVAMMGIFLGKVLLKGSEGVYPKLKELWKAFE